MKISLRRLNHSVLFEAQNERGHRIQVEGGRRFGGTGSAPSPTEYLLISQAGCTAMDVVELLRKMHQPLQHIELDMEGHQTTDQVPKVFHHIHIHYRLFGAINPEKADKAISLSVRKYCTISKMIDHVARITYSFEIIPANLEEDQAHG